MCELPRTGRPPSVDPREIRIQARLTSEEHQILEQYASKHNMTKTQVIVEGIKHLIEEDATHAG